MIDGKQIEQRLMKTGALETPRNVFIVRDVAPHETAAICRRIRRWTRVIRVLSVTATFLAIVGWLAIQHHAFSASTTNGTIADISELVKAED